MATRGEVIRVLDRGDRFIVTHRGVPIGELTPLRRRHPVSASALLDALDGAPPIDAARMRADLDVVDERSTS